MDNWKELVSTFGVALDGEAEAKFARYYELLIAWNERMNLTAITQREDVYLKHFADSLVPAARFGRNGSLCDVGTGAGFPGIPLKIVRSDLKLTLMDSLNKRVLFLKEVCAELGLEGVECLHMRAEEAGQGWFRETFDAVTSRAVARLNTLCEYALPLVRVGGFLLAYKANCAEELAEGRKAVNILGGQVDNVEEFELCGQKRTLITIRKVSPTPKRYPRGRGREKCDPIR